MGHICIPADVDNYPERCKTFIHTLNDIGSWPCCDICASTKAYNMGKQQHI